MSDIVKDFAHSCYLHPLSVWFYFVCFVFILIVLKFYKVNLADWFAVIKVVMYFSILLVAQMINVSKSFNQYCKDLDQLYDQKNSLFY